MVPSRVLYQMGNYDILINGVKVEVKVADTVEAVNQAIGQFHSLYRVLGLDYQKVVSVDPKSSYDLLVLCGGDNGFCLVINLHFMQNCIPDSLRQVLRDGDNCIVHSSPLPAAYNNLLKDYNAAIKSIDAGEFAARVLNKPNFKGSNLSQIAREVGVSYEDLKGLSKGTGEIRVEQEYLRVLTAEQVKKAVIQAYTCYKIGVKLLYTR
ncbi:hypothetical protein RND81_11G101900 [Saponaria officinalis]|uniref:Uncharacterized protein n=1 Tax=Saponaria officinalis TaxID=3572 RepID=A0AAW1HLX2_SAPOF